VKRIPHRCRHARRPDLDHVIGCVHGVLVQFVSLSGAFGNLISNSYTITVDVACGTAILPGRPFATDLVPGRKTPFSAESISMPN
jgi:hypothetical protein